MPVMIKIPQPTRDNFRSLLAKQLASMTVSVYRPLLIRALEGLKALDYGEVQDIFAPQKTNTKGYGTKPYTLRRLRMQALGIADLLIAKKKAKKYKGNVIGQVARAFGVKTERFKKWRNMDPHLGKTRDQHIKSFREEIAKHIEWDVARVQAKLKDIAADYKAQGKLSKGK